MRAAISKQFDPSRVTPPPPAVPRLIVTFSRIVLPSPISSAVAPRVLQVLRSNAIAQNG